MTLALELAELPIRLGQILYYVVLPMLTLAGIGYISQRRFAMDMKTLVRLNFYFVAPAVIYYSVVDSPLGGKDVLWVVLFALGMIAVLGVITYVVAAIRRVPKDLRNAMVMCVIFNNSGNYGLPLQELAFRSTGQGDRGMGLQVFIMVTQNFTSFTLGVVLAAAGKQARHWREQFLSIIKYPPVYVLFAALATIWIRNWVGADSPAVHAMLPFWKVLEYIKAAFVALALFTLGAQLATMQAGGRSYPVKATVLLRLALAPLVGLGLIYLMGLQGMLAQVLLISTSTPTAVNCLLLCMEFDNHPEFAARSVFYSTLLSPISVTAVVFLAQGGFFAPMAM